MDNPPVWHNGEYVLPRVFDDRVARNDDLAIRLRMEGLSFRQMARRLKLSTADGAMTRYRAARARQIPQEHLPRPSPRPNGLFIAWAAGFFDGEGSVFGYESLGNRGYRRFTFGVSIAQVVRDPLDEIAQAWGGSVRSKHPSNPRHQEQFHWGIGGRAAATFLGDLLPYLRVKKPAADAAIASLFRTHQRSVPYSDAEVAERRTAVAELARLNRKGRPGRGAASL